MSRPRKLSPGFAAIVKSAQQFAERIRQIVADGETAGNDLGPSAHRCHCRRGGSPNTGPR